MKEGQNLNFAVSIDEFSKIEAFEEYFTLKELRDYLKEKKRSKLSGLKGTQKDKRMSAEDVAIIQKHVDEIKVDEKFLERIDLFNKGRIPVHMMTDDELFYLLKDIKPGQIPK